jgi:hypothetical protein
MSEKLREELDHETLPSEDEKGLVIDHFCIQYKVISYFKDYDTPTTFRNFKAALNDIVNRGVPDPFMAIAKMVKEWSTKVRQFA